MLNDCFTRTERPRHASRAALAKREERVNNALTRHKDFIRCKTSFACSSTPHGPFLHQLQFAFGTVICSDLAYHFVDGGGDHDGLNSRLDELNEAIGRWRERWKGKDGGVAARLRVERKNGGAVLLDSRSGEAKEVVLGPVALELLGHLESPRLFDAIDERYAEDLGRLRELGALFEEGGRVLSLVTG